jgi:hypothetical protein
VLVAVLVGIVGVVGPGAGAATPVAGTPSGTPDGAPIAHPTGADEAILRVETTGGFVPVEWVLTALPDYALYGDGRLIAPGPTTLEFPGAALPNLRQIRLSEAGMQALLREARAAGLLDGGASYPGAPVTDVGTTVVTITAGGQTSEVSAYGLGIEDGVPAEAVAPRQAILGFLELLADPTRLPAGSVLEENQPYEVERLQVVARAATSQEVAESGAPVAWPLDGSLAEFGEPLTELQAQLGDARCGVVEGEEAEAAVAALARTTQLTPWESGGATWRVFVRPLLPDEVGCPARPAAEGTPAA